MLLRLWHNGKENKGPQMIDVASMKPQEIQFLHLAEDGTVEYIERVVRVPLRDEWSADDPDCPSDLK